MATALSFFAFVAFVVALCLWVLGNAVLSGRIRVRGATYARTSEPVMFWLLVAGFGACSP